MLNIQRFGGRGASSSIGNKPTPSQLEALEYYVSGEGMWINQYLRGDEFGGELNAGEKEFLKELDAITQSDNVQQDTLYRTVDASAIFGQMSDSEFDDLRSELNYNTFSKGKGAYSQGIAQKINDRIKGVTGKNITEKGFMSTTKDLSIAENNMYTFGSQKPVILEISGVKGKKGYDVMKNASSRLKQVESSDPQKEVLLAKGQNYKVQSVTSKNGNIYIKVKM